MSSIGKNKLATMSHTHHFDGPIQVYGEPAGCIFETICQTEGCLLKQKITKVHTWDERKTCTKCKYHEHIFSTKTTMPASWHKEFCQLKQDVCAACLFGHTQEKMDHQFSGNTCNVCQYKKPCNNHKLESKGWTITQVFSNSQISSAYCYEKAEVYFLNTNALVCRMWRMCIWFFTPA